MIEGLRRALALLFTLLVGLPLAYSPEETDVPTEYRIACVDDLRALSDLSLNGHTFAGERIVLLNDIEVNRSLSPIGGPDAMFAGSFDGAGYTLSGLVLSGEEFCGLFGYIAPEGSVESLTLEDVLVKSSRYAGAVAAYNAGSIQNCRVIGQSRVSCLSDSQFGSAAGGIAGMNTGSIEGCLYSGMAVDGLYRVGGIAGCVSGGRVSGCVNTASVSSKIGGQASTGGIAGSLRAGGQLTECENRGEVRAPQAQWVGGIAGSAQEGRVYDCVNLASVSGQHPTGGAVGYLSPNALAVRCLNNLRACPLPPIGAGRSNSSLSLLFPYSMLDSLSLSSS